MSEPFVIIERGGLQRADSLERAWSDPTTFAFIGERGGGDAAWVEHGIGALPAKYRKDHFVLLTSGSTGRPKLVVGRRARAEALARVLHEVQDSECVEETILTLPLTYCYAFVNQWLWARVHGRRLVITPGLAQPDRLRDALMASRHAMLCLVGAQVPLLLQYFADLSFPGVIRLHFAGGRFPQEKLPSLDSMFPSAHIFNNYGCAEAMPRLTIRTAEASTLSHHIGWPLPGVELQTDADGKLLFRSPYGAVALRDDSALVEVDEHMWVPTGDLGQIADDGHCELQGRAGDVFKRYGEKISLLQVLNTVRAVWRGHAETYRAVDSHGEAAYVLVLVPLPQEPELRAILKTLSLAHARPHWPLRVESLDEMPLLPNGKPDRMALLNHAQLRIHWRQHV